VRSRRKMVLTAYYLDNPEKKVTQEQLDVLGVLHWNLDPSKYENDPALNAICEERKYTYRDFVDSSKMPNLKEKLATFLIEHLHEDEEIRYFLGGSGYFDVRNELEEGHPWLRIHGRPGDMIILPAGAYHRFIPDDRLSFHVMRLFCGAPIWTPFNRSESETDKRAARLAYLTKFIQPQLDKKSEAKATACAGAVCEGEGGACGKKRKDTTPVECSSCSPGQCDCESSLPAELNAAAVKKWSEAAAKAAAEPAKANGCGVGGCCKDKGAAAGGGCCGGGSGAGGGGGGCCKKQKT